MTDLDKLTRSTPAKYADKEAWLAARREDITSTEVSVLTGQCPYMDIGKLCGTKLGRVGDTFKPNERAEAGIVLEDAIAQWYAKRSGHAVQPLKRYIRIDELRMGSSFDYEWMDAPVIVEIKNVDTLQFQQKWRSVGEYLEGPPHIELQVQYQMLVSGYPRAVIVVCVGGNRLLYSDRVADVELHQEMVKNVQNFWADLGTQNSPQAAEPLELQLCGDKEFPRGDTVDALALKYRELSSEIAALEKGKTSIDKERKIIRDNIRELLGDCSLVRGRNYTLVAKVVKGGPVNYTRKDSYSLRVKVAK